MRRIILLREKLKKYELYVRNTRSPAKTPGAKHSRGLCFSLAEGSLPVVVLALFDPIADEADAAQADRRNDENREDPAVYLFTPAITSQGRMAR